MKFLSFVTAALATFTVVSALTVDPQQSTNPESETIAEPNVARTADLLGGTLGPLLSEVVTLLTGLVPGVVGAGGATCGAGGLGDAVSKILLLLVHITAGTQLPALLAPVCGILNTAGGTAPAINTAAAAVGTSALNTGAAAGTSALNNAAAAGNGALNNAGDPNTLAR
ncbi:hypothetical protein C8R43DRAFT_949073 [Mycena crocata]|nr:hypothetical protein C8R43DRAFT_949073 [Mycena crocata]